MTYRLRCFYWAGSSKTGQKATGSLHAYSRAQFAQLAKEQQIQVKKVVEGEVSSLYRHRFGIKPKQVNELVHQLSTLIESGFPITEALKLGGLSNKQNELSILIHLVRSEILSGASLSDSLSRFTCFEHTLIEYIRIGEGNGKLAQTLRWALQQRERKQNIRRKLRAAVIYPTLVLGVALLVLVIMLMFVLPQFESLFASFSAELPRLTQITLSLSAWMQEHGLSLLIGLALATLVMFKLITKLPGIRYRVDAILLDLPIIGQALKAGEWARFSLILASSLNAGVPILRAWHNATSVTSNRYLQRHLNLAQERIQRGNSLFEALDAMPNLPENLWMLIGVGESSGRLASLLEKASINLEQQLIDLTDNLGKLMEPFIILLLGAIVGTLVLSIYLPIFSLMNSLH